MLGPNTAGLAVPGVASVGIMPGFAANIFRPGAIVSAGTGSGESKVAALTKAGAIVVDLPSQIGPALRDRGVSP